MPTLWNVDSQAAILDPDKPGVAPGAAHTFTDEQAASLAGQWSETDPRSGLPAEIAWKAQRDAPVEPEAPAEPEPVVEPEPEPEGAPEPDAEPPGQSEGERAADIAALEAAQAALEAYDAEHPPAAPEPPAEPVTTSEE